MSDIKDLFSLQKEYNDKVYGTDEIAPRSLEKYTQQLSLCAHAELSSLISATEYKKHHKNQIEPDPDLSRILFESVDVIRYVIAILNLWGFDSERFESAFKKKDEYLNIRKTIEKNKWSGQPVAIVDMDDVIADFRKGFSQWLEESHGVEADVESNEYYFIDALKDKGLNPELAFLDFVNLGGFAQIPVVSKAKNFLLELKEKGYWIHILTARPDDNLQCLYDTYHWLSENDVVFDDISFSSEKFRWCAQSKYYDSDSIKFAIDDSPKHATEYAKHGIKCFVPEKSYNEEVWEKEGIVTYDSFDSFKKHV